MPLQRLINLQRFWDAQKTIHTIHFPIGLIASYFSRSKTNVLRVLICISQEYNVEEGRGLKEKGQELALVYNNYIRVLAVVMEYIISHCKSKHQVHHLTEALQCFHNHPLSHGLNQRFHGVYPVKDGKNFTEYRRT